LVFAVSIADLIGIGTVAEIGPFDREKIVPSLVGMPDFIGSRLGSGIVIAIE
jgi:hypothetical protein